MKKLAITAVAAVMLLQLAWAERSIVKVYPQDKEGWSRVLKTEDLDDLGRGPGYITILASQEQMARLELAGCRLELVAADVDKTPRLTEENRGSFHSFDQIRTELEFIASAYPEIARLDSIGHSWEGRPILCLKISDNVNQSEEEPRLFYMGCLHAREWITTEVTLQLAMMLADSYGTNPGLTQLVDGREFFIVPCANPDGYVYDFGTSNMWRKNRRNNGGSYGVDLNRNFDGSQNGDPAGAWGGAGTSSSPSSDIYCGPSPFSEPEAQAIRDFLLANQVVLSMSYHTYSELLMWPWGYTGSPSPDDHILSALGIQMAALITCEDGVNTYTPQQCMSLYPTTGTSEDWIYGYSRHQTSHTVLAYITEMATSFHNQSSAQIDQIVGQNLEAALLMAQAAEAPYAYAAPGSPALAASDTMPAGGDFTLSWTPANANAGIDRYELHQLTGLSRFTDDAESGIGRWDTIRFKVSTSRYHSATHSFRADSVNNMSALLASRTPFTVQPGDSLSYWRWVSTESGYDYFYAEVSADGGASWTNLETLDGAYTTWTRKAFSLAAYSGQQALVRFRYTTDYMILGGGVYLDDIAPVEAFAVDSLVADTITGQSFDIAGLPVGTYYYKMRAHNAKGWGKWSNLVKVSPVTGVAVGPSTPLGDRSDRLLGASPNPMRHQSRIAYELSKNSEIAIKIYNASGQLVRVAENGVRTAGRHSANWDGRDDLGRQVSAGVYFYRLSVPGFTGTGRLTVVR
jgi:hypothetical protein